MDPTTLKKIIFITFLPENPEISHPLTPDSFSLLSRSNYDPRRRTVILIHEASATVTSNFNRVLVPAFLSGEDVNVICVDWGLGAKSSSAHLNAVNSGIAVAMFINWLTSITGTDLAGYHIVGFCLGAHQAAVAGRFLGGMVPYITALNPIKSTLKSEFRFGRDAAVYTEAIHTSCGDIAMTKPVAHADFYPNGGKFMPGCMDFECDNERAFFYFSESLVSGGFPSRSCMNYENARMGICTGGKETFMGGLWPKNGLTGVFYLKTNVYPPFSKKI